MEAGGVPVIVGEWSLATDNCAMWLNGFNDNTPGYPKETCARVQVSPSSRFKSLFLYTVGILYGVEWCIR